MNINFRAQPDPQLSQRGITGQGQNELPYGKATYLVCRHSPHPKTVCHIKGLNDTPVCVVKDRGYTAGNLRIPAQDQDLCLGHTGAPVDFSLPNNILPSLVHPPTRGKVTQSMRDEITELTRRAGNSPLLTRKDDPLRKYLEDRPHCSTAQELHSSLQGTHYKPAFVDNLNYSPNYLDQEIKILAKLCDILQTDSLAEIQQWLTKASEKDITSRDLLNYQQKLNENEAENLNLQAMLKAQKSIHKGSPEEGNKPRTSTQGSAVSRGARLEREIEGRLLPKRERIAVPTSEDLSRLEHSPSRHQRRNQSPMSPQTSTHLLYSKMRSKRQNLPSKAEARMQSRLQSL
ncbi:uncharacterized protein C4orf17 homolog isoform X2 [Hemicordylus capensis]|uniref:uncharacterized protein C4orf17 homolog isoform X2 n=1 Tax=Hemicordylus capensis TaxID=884348 RepID=UPI002302D589|nr:uncharacterized protein C4orf17 homolog isoform X2 [Hemicordylus capensis]